MSKNRNRALPINQLPTSDPKNPASNPFVKGQNLVDVTTPLPSQAEALLNATAPVTPEDAQRAADRAKKLALGYKTLTLRIHTAEEIFTEEDAYYNPKIYTPVELAKSILRDGYQMGDSNGKGFVISPYAISKVEYAG